MTAWETIREAPRRLGEAANQARPQLRGIISPPRRLSSMSFAVLVVALVVGGMIGMLVLTTALQNQAFEVRAAQRTASELAYRASDLEAEANRANAPGSLGRRATELGMVPNPYAVYIDMRSGEVLGEPIGARGDEIPSLKVSAAHPPAAPATPSESDAPATDPVAVDPAADAPTDGEPVAAEAAPAEAAATGAAG